MTESKYDISVSAAPEKFATRKVRIASFSAGGGEKLFFMAGPCVIESPDKVLEEALELKKIAEEKGFSLVFKASFDKANRTSVSNFRGPGLVKGLEILAEVKKETGLPIVTDVHESWQVEKVAAVADVIQIPAFLCRQTDLLVEAGRSGRVINIKKGQFVAPETMAQAVAKVASTGNENIMLTERGATFGYGNLVVDMRSLSIMRRMGVPVIFDATHSVQLPSGQGSCSGGDRTFVPILARAAVAAGVDGVFMEVHPDPDKALCDGPNSWPLSKFASLTEMLMKVDACVNGE
ncbi:3-deoxy-8-phosphooctulonate synthase [bacterium]|nr:3-deoxy-8-phosphooctulonate synthase [bacterium]